MICDDAREKLFLRQDLAAAEEEHLRSCPQCRDEVELLRATVRALHSGAAPEPSLEFSTRVLASALDELARRRTRAALARAARAVAAALVPLPVILVVDAYALWMLHSLLSIFLPQGLSLYLVLGQAAVIAFLFALVYGSIPILAERQLRPLREVADG